MAIGDGKLGADAFVWDTEMRGDPALPVQSPDPVPLTSDAFTWDTEGLLNPAEPRAPSQVAPLSSISDAARDRVTAASTAKQLLLGGRDVHQAMAIAQQNGNDLAQNEVVRDIQTLSYPELLNKYGPEVANNRGAYLAAERDLINEQVRQRDGQEVATDTVTNIAGGLVTGLGSIATLGAGLVSDDAGLAVAGANQAAREWFEDKLSDVAQSRELLGRIEDQLDSSDNENQYQRDLAAGDSEFMAGLKNIGRNFVDTGANILTDPVRAGRLTSEGLGNLLGSMGVGGIAARLGARVLGPKLINGLVVGSMEAGDAYSQATQHVMGMTESDLQDSEAYQDYRTQGMTHTEAQRAVAGDAGLLAASIQAPLAAALGYTVGRFEQAPLHGVRQASLRDLGRTVLSQTVEETGQEGAAGLSSNIGVKATADADLSLRAGVGESGAMGAIGGAGMAAAARAPATAVNGLLGLGEGAVEAVAQIGATRAAREEAADPTSVSHVEAATTKASESLRAAVVRENPEAEVAPPVDDTTPVEVLREAVQSAPTIPVAETQEGTPEAQAPEERGRALLNAYKQAPNDPAVWGQIAKRLVDGSLDQASRDAFAVDLLGRLHQFEEDTKEIFPFVNDDTKGTDDEFAFFKDMEAAYLAVSSLPVVKAYLKKLESGETKIDIPEITPANVNSPAVTQAITTLGTQAMLAPAAVDVNAARLVMNQAKGNPALDRIRAALETSIELQTQAQRIEEAKDASARKLGVERKKTSVNSVRNDIFIGEAGTKRTLGQRAAEVQKNLRNLTAARAELDDMRDLVMTLLNKRRAINEAKTSGKKKETVRYGRLTRQGWANAGEPGDYHVTYHQNNKGSEQFRMEIEADAQGAMAVYNQLVRAYPQLDATELSLETRHEDARYNAQKPALRTQMDPAVLLDAIQDADAQLAAEEAEAAKKPRESKLRKDAVLKTKESLIDREDDFDEQAGDSDEQRDADQEGNAAAVAGERGGVGDAAGGVGNPDAQGKPPSVGDPRGQEGQDDQGEQAGGQGLQSADRVSTEQPAGVKLSGDGPYVAKDQAKADKATKFIGRGSARSSTTRYAKDFGDRANTGTYKASDVVFISAEGARNGRLDPDFAEIQKAIDAGVTFVTDTKADRERPYNQGERQVAAYLEQHGYKEVESGIWKLESAEKQSTPTTRTPGLKDQLIEQEDAQEAAKPKTVQDLFPHLWVPKLRNGISRVWNAFTMGDKSRWTKLDAVREAIKSRDSINKFAESEIANVNFSHKQRKAAERILNGLVPGLARAMNDRLNNDKYNVRQDPNAPDDGKAHPAKGAKSFIALAQTGDPTGMIAFRNTALVEEVGTEFHYNQDILHAAMLAGAQYLMDARDEHNRDITDAELGAIFRTDKPTAEMRRAVLSGKYANQVVHELGRKMKEYVGFIDNRNAPITDTQGIFDALALEFLRTLEDKGFVEITDFYFQESRTAYTTVKFQGVNKSIDEVRDHLMVVPGFFDGLLLKDAEPVRHIGKPPEAIAKTQMRNKQTHLTKQEQRVLDRVQNMAARVNLPMHGLMLGLGQDLWMELLGYRELHEENQHEFNINHRKSIEGKNTSLEYGWRETMAYVEAVEAVAAGLADEETGRIVRADEVDFFFEYGISKVGRLQQKGFGPQGDKTAREVLTYTRAVLDLTKPEQDDLFWLTVAQSVGIKTEKAHRGEAIKQAKDFFYGNPAMMGVVEIIQDLQGMQLENPKAELHGWQRDRIKELLIGQGDNYGVTAKLMHAVLAVARYDLAWVNGDASEFQHNLALEADGKTDGPINAMVNFIAGEFTVDQIDKFAMGGFFIGKQNYTLNDYATDQGKGLKDLYIEAAENLNTALKDWQALLNGSKGHPDAAQAFEDLMLLLGLVGNVTFNRKTGDITIKRNATKNPLTISVYGSGVAGLSAKIGNEILDAYYKGLSDDLIYDTKVITPEIRKAMDRLVAKYMFMQGGKWVERFQEDSNWGRNTRLVNYADLTKTTLSATQRQVFYENVRIHFGELMKGEIDKMMGTTIESMQMFQRVTQIQAAAALESFKRMVRERTAELKAEGQLQGADVLSQAELEKILKKIDPMGAIIRLDNQTLNIQAKETSEGEIGGETIRGMDGKFTLGVETGEPSQAGVKAAPFMVIATGDGQMVLNIYDRTGGLTRSLPVFDGIEMSADQVDEQSRLINEAVLKGWQENPAMAVRESYVSFLQNSDLLDPNRQWTEADQKLGEQIWRSYWLGIPEAPRYPKQPVLDEKNRPVLDKKGNQVMENVPAALISHELVNMVLNLRDQLEDLTDSIQARKETLAEVQLSVDHMASGEQAVSQSGNAEALPSDPREMVARLNEIYREKLVAIRAKRNLPVVTPVAEGLVDDIQKAGKGLGNYVQEISAPRLVNLLWKGRASEEQKSLLRALAKVLGNDTKVFFGDSKNLTQYRNTNFPHLAQAQAIDRGQYDPATGAIFIAHGSAETVLHELIHAATFGRLLDALAGKEVPAHTQEAVARLKGLFAQFRDTPIRNLRVEVPAVAGVGHGHRGANGSALDLRYTVERILADTRLTPVEREAMALNEFMAWTLSNQPLIEALKKQKVQNKVLLVAFDAVKAIWNLIGSVLGIRMTNPAKDMYSNIRFNTEILIHKQPTNHDLLGSRTMVLNHMTGNSARLTHLISDWTAKLKWYETQDLYNKAHIQRAEKRADYAARLFDIAGFQFTTQQRKAFELVQTGMDAVLELDKDAMLRAHELHKHVMARLTVEDFMTDPQDATQRPVAERKLKTLLGDPKHLKTDRLGRTNLLSSFVALAQVDDQFRAVLDRMPVPSAGKLDRTKGLKANAETLWEQGSGLLGRLLFKHREQSGRVRAQLDGLAVRMQQIDEDSEIEIFKMVREREDKANDWLAEQIQDKTGKAAKKMKELKDAARHEHVKKIYAVGYAIAGAMNHEHGKGMMDFLTETLNKKDTWVPIRNLVAELRGTTDDTAAITALVNKVRAQVSSIRQDYREFVPKMIQDQFSKRVKKEQWEKLYRALGKTDITALARWNLGDVTRVIEDANFRNSEIARLESEIKAMPGLKPHQSKLQLRKARDLAVWMTTGKTPDKFLRNAHAIAHLFGEKPSDRVLKPSDDHIRAINELTTLYAVAALDQDIRDFTVEMFRTEAKGMEFIMRYMAALRNYESHKKVNQRVINNHYKGKMDVLRTDASNIIVAPDSEFKNLRNLSYERIGDYKHDALDTAGGALGYYRSTVAGRATFNQGVMQTVQKTMFGVDAMTGYSLGSEIAGRITEKGKVASIRALTEGYGARSGDAMHLMPVFNDAGEVIAYERPLDPQIMSEVVVNHDLTHVLGAWAGRLEEEHLSSAYNRELVHTLRQIWDRDRKKGKAGEFVNIATSDDPIHKDLWKIMPKEMKQDIERVFGPNSFMVRRDMEENALGYREASVGDAFTGLSRLNPKAQKVIFDTAQTIFGKEAYAKLVKYERLWQGVVSEAKVTIVVKSGVVAFGNIVSNLVQLYLRGVPLAKLASRDTLTKVMETNQYLRNKNRRAELEAKIYANVNDPVAVRRYRAEYKALDDADRSMSIWPLIEGNQFNTISEGLVDQDRALAEGGWLEWIASKFDEAPEGVRTTVKNLVVARDTELFKMLNRSVQYGDFISKAIYFEHLTKNGMEKSQAIRKVDGDFVNYNLLPGRTRGFLESVGLMWFWSFKIRISKIALDIIKENPLRALLWNMGNLAAGINTVFSDNFAGVLADGRAAYTLGPEMVTNIWNMNPFVNLTNG